jgi:hypothetical protein
VTVQNGHLAINGQRVTFFAVNFDFQAILSLINVKQTSTGKTRVLDVAQCAVFETQILNLVNAGIRAVRIHGMDNCGEPNIFASGTTRAFDPVSLQALDYFISRLEAHGLHYVLDLHYTRQLTAADQPPWACPLFQECTTDSFLGSPVGLMSPWMWFDDGLMALTREYVANLLGHVNQYTQLPIGRGTGLLAVVLENEQSISKTASWGYPAHPQLNAAFTSDTAAWCQANNIPTNKFGGPQHAQYAAWKETQILGAYATYVRTLTPALVIADTYFGNGPYSQLVSIATVGDCVDSHFYSRYSPSDTNGFLTGQTATDARSRFAAVLAGAGFGKPQFVTEWGPVGQYKPLSQDPPAERSQVLAAAVNTAIAQDVDFIALYSYAHSNVFSEGSPYWAPDVYDFRIDPVLMYGLQSQAARFHDLSLRPTSSVTVTPTGGIYGAYGPYNDAALYQIPAGQKVVIQQ